MKLLLTILSLGAFSIVSNAQDCVDLSAYSVSYLDSVSLDNTTYPVGTAFVTSGNIQYVKPSTGNYYQGIQGDSLFYIGDIDIDVSLESCPNKELVFSCAYLEGLAVDGDTIFDQLNPPAFYQGNGWEFEFDGQSEYVITGDFNVISLYSQTNFLYDVCLECVPVVISSECVSLAAYDVNYLNNVSTDHVTYPVGDPFVTSGNIQYVKPDMGSYYQGIQGDSLFYIGNLDIDVSLSTCTNKVLTFSCAYLEGLAVDGDTIFDQLNPPAFYQGNGWEFEHVGQFEYMVSGDFDVVSLYTQTNFLYDVCLDCLSEASTEELSLNDINVYPNPTNGVVTVSTGLNAFSYRVLSTEGRLITEDKISGESVLLDLSNELNGIYFLQIISNGGTVMTKRMIVAK